MRKKVQKGFVIVPKITKPRCTVAIRLPCGCAAEVAGLLEVIAKTTCVGKIRHREHRRGLGLYVTVVSRRTRTTKYIVEKKLVPSVTAFVEGNGVADSITVRKRS